MIEAIIAEGEVSIFMTYDGVVKWLFRSGNVLVGTEEMGRIVVSVNPFRY